MARSRPTPEQAREELRERERKKNTARNEIERRRRARANLLDFICYVNPDYEPQWYHVLICRYLDLWVSREIVRLGVFTPSQHGKSEIVSRHLPAYIFGRDPDAHVMTASYAASLATAMNRDVQRIMDSEAYLRLFPDTRLYSENIRTMAQGSWLRNADEFEVVNRKGYYRCAGVGGGLTGRNFDYGIIDDPVKDSVDADSAVERRKKIAWYNTVFRTRRRNDDSSILICQTRWHQTDLSGHLLDVATTSSGADQWEVLSLPAMCEDPDDEARQICRVGMVPAKTPDPSVREQIKLRDIDDSLWPSCAGRTKFNEASLRATRASISPYQWSAMYQQKPTPSEGVVFHAAHFRTFWPEHYDGRVAFVVLPAHDSDDPEQPPKHSRYKVEDCIWFQTADTAMKDGEDNDYTVIGTFCQTPDNDLLVWDIWRGKLGIPHQYPAMQKIRAGRMPGQNIAFEDWLAFPADPWPRPIVFQAVEEAASGINLLQQAALEGNPLRALKADKSKVIRAAPVATMYFNGKVRHKRGAAWVSDAEKELTSFPAGTYDDIADVISYAGLLVTHDALFRRSGSAQDFLVNHGFDADVEPSDDEKRAAAQREKERLADEALTELRHLQATSDVTVIRGYGQDVVIDWND